MKKLYLIMICIIFFQIMICYAVFSQSNKKVNKTNLVSITIKPVNEKSFNKKLSKGGMDEMFGRIPMQKGLITYSSENNQNMIITNEELINKFGSKNHKLLLKTLKDFLSGQNKSRISLNKNENLDLSQLFDDCIDYECQVRGKITGIKYPGMDKVVVAYSFDTQNPPAAAINVRIFAQKGKDYVMLVRETGLSICDNENSVSPALNNCFKKFGNTLKCDKCSIESINSDYKTKELLKKAAEEIINKYRLK